MQEKTRRKSGVFSMISFQLPELDLAGLFIKPQIAVIAGGADLPRRQGLGYRAAGFFPVGAIMELAFSDVATKIREGVLKILL